MDIHLFKWLSQVVFNVDLPRNEFLCRDMLIDEVSVME